MNSIMKRRTWGEIWAPDSEENRTRIRQPGKTKSESGRKYVTREGVCYSSQTVKLKGEMQMRERRERDRNGDGIQGDKQRRRGRSILCRIHISFRRSVTNQPPLTKSNSAAASSPRPNSLRSASSDGRPPRQTHPSRSPRPGC